MKRFLAGVLSLGALVSCNVMAADVTIEAGAREFLPLITQAKPGDRIVFRAMNSHNIKSLEVPEGAQPFESKMSEEGFHFTADKPGAYIFECVPHASFGMIGVVVVGDGMPGNMDQLAKATDPMAKRGYKKLKQWLEEKGIK